jgi:glutamate synthase domain-containing protein 2
MSDGERTTRRKDSESIYRNVIHEKFKPSIDRNICIRCKRCVKECSFGALESDDDGNIRYKGNCVACQRCVATCPVKAIDIVHLPTQYPPHASYTERVRQAITAQATSGGVLLSSCGTDMPYGMIFDDLILDSAQVTNPSIDPLREEVETRTYVGHRTGKITLSSDGYITGSDSVGPIVAMAMPLMIGHISLGAISYNTQLALLKAAKNLDILAGSGEGGLHADFNPFADHVVSEVASGRFGVTADYLQRTAAVEIKIGQGAKPGVGGHLPGEKVTDLISSSRRIPLGTDALSPYPHHDIYSIEDLQQLIAALKESTEHRVPVGVKIAAVHNVGAIASGVVRAGADFITLDGFRGGTGSSPRVIRDHAGLPIEVATAVVDKRLTAEGLRNRITLIAGGSIRSSADMIKAIALGADVASVCTSALIAMGCQVCQSCHRGVCAWGITTQRPDLVSRLDPDIGAARVTRLYTAWNEELKEMLGAMGIDSVESLVGNRDRLRYFGPNPKIAEIMGVKHVGEGWG